MNKLIRSYPQLDEALINAYCILSVAGFSIQIEEGAMTVWHEVGDIEMDVEQGIVIIDSDYYEEFWKRQSEL